MSRLVLSGVGVAGTGFALNDRWGTGLLPVQVHVPATATVSYRINGRVSPDAPWREIKAPSSADMLESMAYVPYLQLEVLTYTGTGEVALWVGET
jgi:hypothetical protein